MEYVDREMLRCLVMGSWTPLRRRPQFVEASVCAAAYTSLAAARTPGKSRRTPMQNQVH